MRLVQERTLAIAVETEPSTAVIVVYTYLKYSVYHFKNILNKNISNQNTSYKPAVMQCFTSMHMVKL